MFLCDLKNMIELNDRFINLRDIIELKLYDIELQAEPDWILNVNYTALQFYQES
jgi:hypothetical protein